MRRNVLSAAALACTAVLASAMPAFADDPSPVPDTAVSTEQPRDQVAETAPSPAPAEPGAAAPAEDTGGVSVVPRGAPDTGEAPASAQAGGDGLLLGGGAAAVAAAGGAVFLVVRRRASGA
ncbi:sortase-dependent protein [Streptomyces sp. NPDC096538]|uniref:sortase-dependent protein n=1 Tax=Streptomyces sp. NPDC096538 TaxID=3155427 RepID=UPI0033341128